MPAEVAALPVRVDEMEYDDRGNLTVLRMAVGTADERQKTYVYDPDFSKVTRYTDFDGFETTYVYDQFGDLTTMTDAEGNARSYTYTSLGLIDEVTDENGNTTSYSYDSKLNVIGVMLPDGTVNTMAYNAYGKVTRFTLATGLPEQRSILTTYDIENRLVSRETVDSTGAPWTGKQPMSSTVSGI